MKFNNLFRRTPAPDTAMPTGDLRQLARAGTSSQGGDKTFELLQKIQQMMTSRSRQDIGTWRTAITAAENIQQPSRIRLYLVYKDVLLDDQVETVIENLMADLLSQEWFVGDAITEEKDDEATALLERPWFYEFNRYAVESKIHGHSLVEFAPPTLIDGKRELYDITLIPREHVVPEWGIVTINPGDADGIKYRGPEYLKTVVEIGKPNELGWLLKAARPALYKKNVESAWSQYSEIFGMPIRIGKVASRNKADLDRMEEFLKTMGQAAYAVTDIDDKIEFAETSKGDAYQVFDKFISKCDAAIAKIFLGQTMTTDNGSSRSQAEVHERVAEQRMKSLKTFLKFTIQQCLWPLLVANGYPLQGKKFVWAATDEITELDIQMDQFITQSFELKDLDYFIKKYKVPITALRAMQGVAAQPAADAGKDKVKKPGKEKEALGRIAQLHHDIHQLYDNKDGNCC